VERFVAQASAELGKESPSVPAELYPLLRSHSFPGNVRELEAMIFEAVNAETGGELSLSTFREALGNAASSEKEIVAGALPSDATVSFVFPNPLPSASELTEMLFDEALKRADGNQSVAARLLGVSPQAVSKRLKSRKTKDDNPG